MVCDSIILDSLEWWNMLSRWFIFCLYCFFDGEEMSLVIWWVRWVGWFKCGLFDMYKVCGIINWVGVLGLNGIMLNSNGLLYLLCLVCCKSCLVWLVSLVKGMVCWKVWVIL